MINQIIFFDTPFLGPSPKILDEIPVIMPLINTLGRTVVDSTVFGVTVLAVCQILLSLTDRAFDIPTILEKVKALGSEIINTISQIVVFLNRAEPEQLLESIKDNKEVKFNGFFIKKVSFSIL